MGGDGSCGVLERDLVSEAFKPFDQASGGLLGVNLVEEAAPEFVIVHTV
jgi:hypothetical protein